MWRRMVGRNVAALLAAAAAGLVLAGPSGARPATKVVTLKLGDTFSVTGTHVVCTLQVSKALIPGQKLVGCGVADSKGPVVGSYTVALGVNGEVVIARVKPNRKSTAVVYRRKLSVAGRTATRDYQIGPASLAYFTGTNIVCAVDKSSAGVAVSCFPFSSATANALPSTYGVGITNKLAYIVHFDAKSKAKAIKVLAHGR
jgi:hypothetical protein